MTYTDPDHRLDEVDRRILYALMQDSRDTTAAEIAEQANVSGATIRNRIRNLEELGIIDGYTAQVDFERAGGRLTNLYLCNVPVTEREELAHEARTIPGVINVRSLMNGRRNLHVMAVGEETADFKRIAGSLSKLGIDIEDEDLVEDELFSAYEPFNPEDVVETPEPNDFVSLTGNANVVEVTVRPDAPIAGLTLEEAIRDGVLDDDLLVIAIEREDETLTPHGDTVVRPDDIVTVLSRRGMDVASLEPFQGPHNGVQT